MVDASTDAQEPLPPAVDTTVTQRFVSVASSCSTQSIKSLFYGLVIGEETQSLSPEHVPGIHYLVSTVTKKTKPISCQGLKRRLQVYRSSTATTLQRVGERFCTVPSGADRRGLSNSAAGVTTALRLRARTRSRNRQQTNRPWHTYLVSTILKKTKPVSCQWLKRDYKCTDPLLQQHSKEWARGSALSHRAQIVEA